MITPRRTRLVRVPDLHAFRDAIIRLVSAPASSSPSATAAGAPPSTVVLVPTAGARRQLSRLLGEAPHVAVLTRDEFYDWLHARLPAAAPRLGPLERDSLAQASARAAASALRAMPDLHGPELAGPDPLAIAPERADPDADTNADADRSAADTAAAPTAVSKRDAGVVPFRLRPGLIAEMLRFYDQLRRQSQRLERFNELIEETLGGGAGDRGTDRLLSQTRFLNETFRELERRVERSGAWDEHTLRARLMQTPIAPTLDHVVVTVADWIAEPDGLYIGDFDLLARMPGVQQLDLVCTEQLLGSEFHERIHSWWPGLDEVDAVDLLGPAERRRPRLETPRDGSDHLWFTHRDREQELVAVAQHVKAARRRGEAAPLDQTAVVFKHPLPYLYLAEGTLGAAHLPFTAADALPLAGEPYVATLDLVLELVESSFARDGLLALLATPHLRIGDPPPSAAALRAFDRELRERGYLGDLVRLEELAAGWGEEPATGSATPARPALDAALLLARRLAPLLDAAPASMQVQRVIDFLAAHAAPIVAGEPHADREQRARAVVGDLLLGLATAHAAHHDPDWTIVDLAAAIRRWVEEQTFAGREPTATGVQLLDDRAVRYGAFADITIVGVIETEWPEKQARNIFYPSGLLKALGWPSEHTRRRASDARFVDLMATATQRVAVSTVTLDDEALVMRSMQLDEIPRARLSTAPAVDDLARITADDALTAEPVRLDVLAPAARRWADLRVARTPTADPRFHGSVGARPERPWSVSALEAYLACPFKFFAQHVLKLDEEPEDSDVMNPRQQGQFVHKVFEQFFATWKRTGHGGITPELLDEARAIFAEVVEQELQSLPEAEAGLERTRLLGSPAAAGLGEAVMRMEAERPVRVVERLLEARLDGPVTIATAAGPRVIQLKGKADRIDLLADGSFRLVDYKLGWPPQRARALQLPIYALAAQQRLREQQGQSWELGEAAYLAFKGPKRVVPLYSQPADREKVLAEAQQRVADTLDAIGRGEFPPRPEDVFLCETCSFAAVCRKDYVDE